MLTLLRTDAQNEDFQTLVPHLDAYLRIMDGADHAFFAQYNHIEQLQQVVVAYWDDQAVGCGAIKPFDNQAFEIKRMYVDPTFRGRKIASGILAELEAWARSLGGQRCILETGKKQVEAIGLYQKCGYERIPNFGPYEGVDLSICFGKAL